jgi:hypothetical protein
MAPAEYGEYKNSLPAPFIPLCDLHSSLGDKKKNSISDIQYAMTREMDQSDRADTVSDNGEKGEKNEGR